ncbi:MAG: TonB-dependent receptor domain-containing protein, partial [Niabella sp.]
NQTTEGIDVGLALGFLNGRINLDLAYYNNRTFNQILSANIPPSSGATTFVFNTGQTSNKGIEITLNAQAIKQENFRWDITLNASKNNNWVDKLDGNAQYIQFASLWDTYGPAIRLTEGDRFGTIYGYIIQRDAQGRKIVTNDGTRYLVEAERTPMGNTSPKWLAGLNNTFQYKNFELRTLVDAKIGGDMFSGTYGYSILTGQSPMTLKERMGGGLPYTDANGNTRNIGVVMEGVKENGQINDEVVHYLWKYMGNMGVGWGDWSLPDGRRFKFNDESVIFENTWVKMREISLAYHLPKTITNRIKVIQGLTAYLTARDLFYIYKTAPDNINPEGTNGAGNADGFEWGSLPGMRSFALGLRFNF